MDAGVGEAAAAGSAKTAGEAAAAGTAGTAAAEGAGAAAAGSGAAAGAAGAGAAAAGTAAGAAAGTGAGLTIGQQLAVGAGASLASGVIQKVMTPSLSGAPQAPGVLDMPTADSQAVADAKKKSIIEQMASRGRASTILTDTTDKLGG